MRAAALLLALAVVGCARPAHRLDFDRQLYAAERLADRGRSEEAASTIGALARRAYLEEDAVRLHIRAADLHLRSGELSSAMGELESARRLNLDRNQAALVRLRYARMADRSMGRPDRARRMYLKLIHRFPDTVAARLALRDAREMSARAFGPGAWMSFLDHALLLTEGRALRHAVAVHLAREHLREGDRSSARAILQDLHRRYPDSAVWHTATNLLIELHREAGRHEQEAAALLRLVSRFERTSKPGTYDSEIYTRGELRLGVLYCEHIGRAADGVWWFEQFAPRHPTSRLRDDALWQLALCHDRMGEQGQRWSALCRLMAEHPLSRWAKKARAAAQEKGRPLAEGRCTGGDLARVSHGGAP